MGGTEVPPDGLVGDPCGDKPVLVFGVINLDESAVCQNLGGDQVAAAILAAQGGSKSRGIYFKHSRRTTFRQADLVP